MGPPSVGTEGIEELVVDTLHDLADSGHPSSEPLGPAPLEAVALRRMDDARSVMFEPTAVVLKTLEAFVGHAVSRGSLSHAGEPRVRMASGFEEGLGQRLVGGGGRPEAVAGDGTPRAHGHEELESLVPPQAVGPSNAGLSGQPPRAPALGVPDCHRRAVEGFVRTSPNLRRFRQTQGGLLDGFRVRAHGAVELGTIWQGGESAAQVGMGVAVEIPPASEAGESGEDGEGYDLAGAEGGFGSGAAALFGSSLEEIVRHEVECGEEGVHIEHEESVPFPSGSGSKPTLVRGHLPPKFPTGNSHQAFKEIWYQSFNQQLWAAGLVGRNREACGTYIKHFLDHWASEPGLFDEDLEAWVDNFMKPGNLQGGFNWYVGIDEARTEIWCRGAPDLPKIEVPTRFYWGEQDSLIKIEWADRLGDYFSDYSFERAPEAGHFVHYERPEAANREISAFFSEKEVPG